MLITGEHIKLITDQNNYYLQGAILLPPQITKESFMFLFEYCNNKSF